MKVHTMDGVIPPALRKNQDETRLNREARLAIEQGAGPRGPAETPMQANYDPDDQGLATISRR